MNFTPIKIFLKSSGQWIAKHSPTILTVVGSGGVVTSTVLAVKATPRAMKRIEAKKKELGKDKLTVKETIKTCWKEYIPTAGVAVGTICCFAGINAIHMKHQAALAGLYSIAEQGLMAKDRELTALKDEVAKAVGEDKAKEIQEKIETRKKEEEYKGSYEWMETGQKVLFSFYGQEFVTTWAAIKEAQINIMERLYSGFEMYISLNEILIELGLAPIEQFGDLLKITVDDRINFRPEEVRVTKHGQICVVIGLEVPPHEL